MKKIKGIISVAVLTVGAVLSTPTFACSDAPEGDGVFGSGILSTQAQHNQNLGCGTYEFASAHSGSNYSFIDLWTFTVAENATVSISVFDTELDFDSQEDKPAKIFDNTNLKFALHDRETGEFLAWGNENQTLSGLSVLAGRWYTVKVYGDVAGVFGSTYHGALETCEVPLGDTAPMLGSALGLLALRLRKRKTQNCECNGLS